MRWVVDLPKVVAIPTRIRPREVKLDTVKIGLQRVVPVIVWCHERDENRIYSLYREYAVDDFQKHRLNSISSVRFLIFEYLQKHFPEHLKYMFDDDCKGFQRGFYWDENGTWVPPGFRKPPEFVNDPEKILQYLLELAGKAIELGASCFGPSTNFKAATKFPSGCKNKYRQYSRSAVVKGVMGFVPGCPNPFLNDPGLTSMEETIALWNLMQAAPKPMCRDNNTALDIHMDPKDEMARDRRYSVMRAAKICGWSWLHKYHSPTLQTYYPRRTL